MDVGQLQVSSDDRQSFFQGGRQGAWLENPGISQCSPAHHNSVTPGFLHHVQSVLITEYIAIADNRDGDSLFNPVYHLAVSQPAKHLLPGSGVDGHGLCPGSFCHGGKFRRCDGLICPAAAKFYSYRQMRIGHYGPNNLLGKP